MQLEQMYPALAEKIAKARQSGVSDEKIGEYIQGRIESVREQGVSDEKINQFLGTKAQPAEPKEEPYNEFMSGDIPYYGARDQGDWMEKAGNIAQQGASFASSAVALPAAGVVGLADMLFTPPPKPKQGQTDMEALLYDAEETMNKATELFTISPPMGKFGEKVSRASSVPFEELRKFWHEAGTFAGRGGMADPVSPEGWDQLEKNMKEGITEPYVATAVATFGELWTYTTMGKIAHGAMSNVKAGKFWSRKEFREAFNKEMFDAMAEKDNKGGPPPPPGDGPLGPEVPEPPPVDPSEAAWRQLGEDVYGRISRGYLGEVIPGAGERGGYVGEMLPGREISPEAQWIAYGEKAPGTPHLGDVVPGERPSPTPLPNLGEEIPGRPVSPDAAWESYGRNMPEPYLGEVIPGRGEPPPPPGAQRPPQPPPQPPQAPPGQGPVPPAPPAAPGGGGIGLDAIIDEAMNKKGKTSPPGQDLRAEIVRKMSEHRDKKPRPLKKMYGKNPTAEDIVEHNTLMKEWEKENRSLKRQLDAVDKAIAEGDQPAPPTKPETPLQVGDEVQYRDSTGATMDATVVAPTPDGDVVIRTKSGLTIKSKRASLVEPTEFPNEFGDGWKREQTWDNGMVQYTNRNPKSPLHGNTIAAMKPGELNRKVAALAEKYRLANIGNNPSSVTKREFIEGTPPLTDYNHPMYRNGSAKPALLVEGEVIVGEKARTHDAVYDEAMQNGEWPAGFEPEEATRAIEYNGNVVDITGDQRAAKEALHRATVEAALAKHKAGEGPAVPDHILRDYPELGGRGRDRGTITPEEVKGQARELYDDMVQWEPNKDIFDENGKFVRRQRSTYPPWFKKNFPHESKGYVMETIRNWVDKGEDYYQNQPKPSKRRQRVIDVLQDVIKDSMEKGVHVVEDGYRSRLSGEGGFLNVGGIVESVGKLKDVDWAKAKRSVVEFFDQFAYVTEDNPAPRPKGFSPGPVVPKSASNLARRSGAMGDIARVNKLVGKVYDSMREFSPSVRFDMFQFIRGEVPIEFLPEEARPLAKRLKWLNNSAGKMAVKRGLIPQEVFDKLKDSYVHYMYLRHYLPSDAPIKILSSGKMDLSVFKHRKDLSYEARQALGLIEDAQIAVPVGLGKTLSDVMKHDYFKALAADKNIVFEPSKVEFMNANGKKVKWGVGKLKEEIKIRERQARDNPGQVTPEYVKYTEYLKEQASKLPEGEIPEGYTQVPTDKAYGELAGTYMRTPVANDVLPMMDAIGSDAGSLWRIAKSVTERGTAAFKMGKVALNPPTIVRNVFSNFLQMNMSGIPLYDIPRVYIDGIRSFLAKDMHYTKGFRDGLFQTNFTVAELGEIVKEFQRAETQGTSAVFDAIHNIARKYGAIDDIAKMSLYKDAMLRRGMTHEQAIAHAQRWGMDYSLASRSIKAGRKQILPFVSYQYKIAPLIMETLRYRPWVIAKFAAIPYAMWKVAAQMNGWTPEKVEKIKKMVGEMTRGKGTMMAVPWLDAKGNPQVADFQFFMPWGNWLEMIKEVGSGNIMEGMTGFGVGGWWTNILNVLTTNTHGKPPRDPFSGMEIYSQFDDPSTQLLKQGEWYMNLFMPSAFTRYGAAGYSFRAITGQKDRWDREVSPGGAALRWVGVNTRPVDERQIMVGRKAKMKDLNADFWRKSRDPRLTPKERTDLMKKWNEKRREIVQGESR